jgi:RNA polymerase sigma-70 factor (ECF subfamily)
VPNWADAADILQETSSVMWRKFDQFEAGTNFFAWACQIARLEVATFRKRNRHRLLLSEQFVDTMAPKAEAMTEVLESRNRYLIDCLQKLRPRDRDLLRDRYFEGCTVESLAGRTGRTIEAVYKALQRVRRQLFECVERASTQGGPS